MQDEAESTLLSQPRNLSIRQKMCEIFGRGRSEHVETGGLPVRAPPRKKTAAGCAGPLWKAPPLVTKLPRSKGAANDLESGCTDVGRRRCSELYPGCATDTTIRGCAKTVKGNIDQAKVRMFLQEKRKNMDRRTQDQDQRCQSGSSAKNSVIFSGGTLQRIMGQTNNDCRFLIFTLTSSLHQQPLLAGR